MTVDILKADEQTTEPTKSNKIVKPKLITEELDPKCFTANPKPLAIGLDKEIIANEELKPEAERVSKTSIKQFLGAYNSKYKYLQSCTLGAARIDLEGNEVGVLDQEAVDFAKEKLANCKAWQNQCNTWKLKIKETK